MRQLSLLALLLAVLSTHSGCSVAKRGFTELRGAHGDTYAVRDARPEFYGKLSGITVGRVSNSIAPVCPASMRAAVENALRDRAAQASEAMTGDGGACTLDVDITFNKEPGGVMALAGRGALLIGRATVRGAGAGQAADLIVVVASKAMRTSSTEMAEVFADTLIRKIRKGAE